MATAVKFDEVQNASAGSGNAQLYGAFPAPLGKWKSFTGEIRGIDLKVDRAGLEFMSLFVVNGQCSANIMIYTEPEKTMYPESSQTSYLLALQSLGCYTRRDDGTAILDPDKFEAAKGTIIGFAAKLKENWTLSKNGEMEYPNLGFIFNGGAPKLLPVQGEPIWPRPAGMSEFSPAPAPAYASQTEDEIPF